MHYLIHHVCWGNCHIHSHWGTSCIPWTTHARASVPNLWNPKKQGSLKVIMITTFVSVQANKSISMNCMVFSFHQYYFTLSRANYIIQPKVKLLSWKSEYLVIQKNANLNNSSVNLENCASKNGKMVEHWAVFDRNWTHVLCMML